MDCPNCHHRFDKPPGGQIPYTCPHCKSQVLGVYCELALVGSGAMGDVYRGLRPDMGRRMVAIKVPKASESRACNRFEREIAASARLRHENIVCAFDRGEEDGRPYLVMEYVSGRVLSDMIEAEHPISAAVAADIIRQVAAGLGHAATQRIVNRDIKPDNVLITSDGTAKIMDYGLALIGDLDGSPDRVTRNGTLLGTPGFLAPEQAVDPRCVTVAADIYSLGCAAHCLLTKRPPFTGKDTFAILKQHSGAPRPSVRQKRPDVDVALDELIQRMMSVAADDRPTPRELVQQLDRLIPELNATRPSLAGPSSGMIDARCPGCQEVYHLRAEMIGKVMQCRNKLCGERFEIEPPLDAPMHSRPAVYPPTMTAAVDPEPLEAEPLEAEAVEAEAIEPEAVEAEPVETELPPVQHGSVWAEAVEAEAFEAEAVEAEAVEAEAVAVDAEPVGDSAASSLETVSALAVKIDTPAESPLPVAPAVQQPPRRELTPAQKRKRRSRLIGLAGLAALAVAAPLIWINRPQPEPPSVRWEKALAAYRERQWRLAEKQFNQFAADFPDDEHVSEIPYFLAMSEIGDLIYSDAYRGRREEALQGASKVFDEHRDNPAYQEYSGDLFAALKRLVESFLSAAQKHPPALAKAREAHELLQTIGAGAKEEQRSQANSDIQSLGRQIAMAESEQREQSVRQEILAELQKAQALEPSADIDALYAKVDGLLTPYPKLAEDPEIADLKKKAWLHEPERVRYVRRDDVPPVEPAGTLSSSSAQDLFVIWDPRGTEQRRADDHVSPSRRERVLTAVSRGVLYVFDAQGNFLWARRLGVDSHRLPLHMPATAVSPAALIAVSTEDNTLYSLDALRGSVLWRFKTGGVDIASPLTIVTSSAGPNQPDRQRGLLPTADGKISVLELVLGRQLGHFELGHSLAPVGGGFDAINQLAYFPADSQRVFAINTRAIDDPDEPACKSVLFTGHASGALRCEPTIVDRSTPEYPQAYMILAEATNLDSMELKVFDLSETSRANPRAAPVNHDQRAILRGWSWSAPLASPDRITLVTDEGELGVFGLNLDNSREALYRVIGQESSRLAVHDRFRSLAVDSDERHLWVMAGGALRKLKLDVLGQQIRPIWPKPDQTALVTGIPLHEAQLDERGEHMFLSLMSTDGSRFDFLAVDSAQGKPVWQRQLGVQLFGDPLIVGQRVLLLDHSGRSIMLDPSSSQMVYQPTDGALLPAGAEAQHLMRIVDDSGNARLVAPSADGASLAITSLAAAGKAPLTWNRVSLTVPLQGRPCICGDYLICPSADGTLRRAPLRPEVKPDVNEQSYFWMPGRFGQNRDPGPERADVYALGPSSILLVAAGREIRHLELREEKNVPLWRQVGNSLESDSPLRGPVLVAGQRGLVVDAMGVVRAFDVADPAQARGTWQLGGRPTGEAFLRDGKVLTVVDGDRLVAIDPEVSNEGQPLWSSESLRGQIRGQPVAAGNELLVADESRRVTALRMSDGTVAWQASIRPRIGPGAAAVPFGADRILVPLADGTFSVIARPPVEKQVAGAAGSEQP